MLEWLWVLVSYLMGSIPFGLLVAHIFCKINPQKGGSGNIGATNVTRLCGLPAGIATLLFDAGKGAAAIYLGRLIVTDLESSRETLFITLYALAAIFGHMHSVFLKFRGGKAVATTLGIFLYLAPVQTLIAAGLCVLAIAWKKYVSLGSLVLVTSLPLLILFSGRLDLAALSVASALLVIYAHRSNIGRLLRGEEKSWQRNVKV